MWGHPVKYEPKPMGVEIVNDEMGLLLASTEGGCICWDGHARKGEPRDYYLSRYARFTNTTEVAQFCAMHSLRLVSEEKSS